MGRLPRVTASVLALAAAVNLVVLAGLPPNAFPLAIHSDPSLVTLFSEERISLRDEYGIYGVLGDVGSGRILVAPSGIFEPMFVDGLADLEFRPVESTNADDTSVAGEGAITGVFIASDGTTYDYFVLAPAADDAVMVATVSGGTIVVSGAADVPTP